MAEAMGLQQTRRGGALDRVIQHVRSAPLAGHADLVALLGAVATRVAEAQVQFPDLDLDAVSERIDGACDALDGVCSCMGSHAELAREIDDDDHRHEVR